MARRGWGGVGVAVVLVVVERFGFGVDGSGDAQ